MYRNLEEARYTGVQTVQIDRNSSSFLVNGICQQRRTARRFERVTHAPPPPFASHICLISRPMMAVGGAILDAIADRLPARKTEPCGVAN